MHDWAAQRRERPEFVHPRVLVCTRSSHLGRNSTVTGRSPRMDLYRRNMSTFGAEIRMWPTSDPYMTRHVSVRSSTPRGHTTQPDCASASATCWFRGSYASIHIIIILKLSESTLLLVSISASSLQLLVSILLPPLPRSKAPTLFRPWLCGAMELMGVTRSAVKS